MSVYQLNTRGMLARNPGEVFAQVAGDDILVFTESWLGEAEAAPPQPGYMAFHFPRLAPGSRQAQGRAARGGVVVYVRQHLAAHTTVWRSSTFGTHAWIRVDKAAGLTDHLLLAACYIPPKQRTAHSQDVADVWDDIAADIAAAQAEGLVLLAGDLNARTATLQDWDHNDAHDGLHNAALLDVVLYSQEGLVQPPVCTQRSSQDPSINEFGRALIALCRSTDMRICNGRTEGDLEGACTCFPFRGGKSLVDYFVACPNLMPCVRHLSVSPPAVGFDHCGVRIQLGCRAPAAREAQQAAEGGKREVPVIHPGYRVVPAAIPAFAELLAEATSGGLEAQMREGAAAAHSLGDLDRLVSRLDDAIHSSLKAAGMPELPIGGPAARQGPRPGGAGGQTQHLRRQKRAAVRHADWEKVQQLNRELLRLRNRRRRQDKAATAAALVLLARADRSAFWQKWKKRLSSEGPIAAEDFLAYFKQLFGSVPPSLAAAASAAGQTQINELGVAEHPDNTDLCQPFAAAEVASAIEMLQQRKSVLGFLKLEFLAPVAPILAPLLAELFNACARLQSLPQAWALGAITPLLKPGGNPSDCSSYRGITVGTLLAKLYATVINTRITTWAEDNYLRARGQGGFRKDHRTTDQIFVLRTLIEQQRMAGTPLYVCFVDFQKAYDTVPRDQLWGKLERMGIKGFILDAIRALYADVPVCVRTRQGLTPTFQSLMGVKQGCPLSPTLFGLYIDDFEAVIMGRMGMAMPQLGAEPAPPLLYADDLALMATTAEGLQRQLEFLGDYATRWQLTVNIKKTKVLVFLPLRKRAGALEINFTYQGERLAVVDSFRYLGVELHGTQPFGAAAGPLAASGRRALQAMRRRCAELGLTDPQLQIELFDTLVTPVLSYGAEVWATQFLLGAANPCEQLHRSFLRRILGVRLATPTEVIYAELGRFQLSVQWAKLTARFWTRLVRMDDSRLVKQAFTLSLELAGRTPASLPVAHRPWAAHVGSFCEGLGMGVDLSAPTEIAAAEIVKTMQEHHVGALAACAKSKVQYYVSCVRGEVSLEGYQPAAYLAALADRPRLVRLAQLRTGSHWLKVETGRWQRLERSQRLCPHCDAGAVEDEVHMVFDCALYAGVRQQYADLFCSGDRNLGSFLSQPPVRVAQFVHQCFLLTA